VSSFFSSRAVSTHLHRATPSFSRDGNLGAEEAGPTHDHLPGCLFEFVPLWQVIVLFAYAPRRVDCSSCGATVEIHPWAEGTCQLTKTYRWLLAGWAKRLSWKEVAEVYDTTWQNVCRSVEMAVEWGLAHRVS
jgi:hypothetical protein